MQVIQATFGTFHQFHLARELKSRGFLRHIYSTYPWSRLQREGLPRNCVSTFPWVHVLRLGLSKYLSPPRRIQGFLDDAIATTFDDWLCKVLPQAKPADAYVALSGAGVKSGRLAQRMGAKYVCDRGSSHMRYQYQIIMEEYRRWGIERSSALPKSVTREEAEYESADAITVPSSFAHKTFIECGVPAEKIRTFMLGVELGAFRPVGEPPSDRFEILFAGSVCFRKGIPYLLEAFRRLQHPRKHLRLIGTVMDEIRPYLKTQDLNHVEITGPLPQSELAKHMSQSHVLVLPSIEDGFGMVMSQAMACGCPVISTFNTGGPDLYTDNKEGFFVPIRSPEAILLALQKLVDDPSLQQKMSEASLLRVRSFGGWHQYGENYSNFLKELCGCD